VVSFAVELRSADFQEVAVAGAVTWRVTNAERLAERIDFAIDLTRGVYLRQPLEAVANQFVELARQHADSLISALPLRDVLRQGSDRLREALTHAFATTETAESGLEVVSVRIISVRPKPETERAMEAPMRERIQQDADEAAFARRAMAVEKERAIAENELQNQIELAKRDEQLIAQRGANERRQASEKGAAMQIAAEAKAAQLRVDTASKADATLRLAAADAERVKLVDGANVDIERARWAAQLEWETGRVAARREVPPHVLYGLAAQELASKLESIDHLSIGTEVLGPLLTRLVDAGAQKLESDR
jgi:regulator of protease activity HflC (stomatin/prohibitin superfamily)